MCGASRDVARGDTPAEHVVASPPHGTQDPVIPLSWAPRSRDRLAALGYAVEWHEYQMPHSVCAEEIADIGRWLRVVLPAS